jgi:hypothetical protein
LKFPKCWIQKSMTKSIITLAFFLFFTVNELIAQIPIGGWRDHFPYVQANLVAKTTDKVFCATPYALFYYNLKDNSVEKLSRTNGLSDIEPCALRYNPEKDLLVVTYENANIDLIQGNNIRNLSDIKHKAIQGNKKIYHIEFQDNLAYLACGFGIVVIDLDKKEVKDTYYIGENASSVQVNSIAFDTDNIYAATESGIYYASLTNSNLVDFRAWQKISTLDFPIGQYKSVVNFESQLLTSYYNPTDSTSIIYKKNGSAWNQVYNQGTLIKNINHSNEKLFLIEQNVVKVLNSNLTENTSISDYQFAIPQPNDCTIDEQGDFYIADNASGLVFGQGDDFQSVIPNGPYTNHVSDIESVNSQIWVAGGGVNTIWGNLYRYAEMYSLVDERWRSNILWDSPARDFLKVLVNPYNPSQVFTGAWGTGVYVFENNQLVVNFNETNSTLQSTIPGVDFINIGGMVLDEAQNLYVTNSGVNEPISVKTAQGDWYSYSYNGISNYAPIGEIINTQYNHKWVQLARGGGLFAFDDNLTPDDTDDDQYRRFSLFDSNGQVVTNEVISLAEDKEGVIWVGTDQGVFTYYNPQNVFTGENFYADRIKVVDNSNDTIVQYLLSSEKVTAISIDGANRKWFGTESSGVFLMSDNAQKEILHFNETNSPLISNFITAICINGKTGEVFIGTDKGMVSYKGTATEGDDNFSNPYVYPNPVRETYNGPITITGLASNVNVKITDIAGQLVYETTAFGGQAIWDGKNYSGRRVNTGVYLVFCTDENGDKTKVLKFLVIN